MPTSIRCKQCRAPMRAVATKTDHRHVWIDVTIDELAQGEQMP